MKYDQCSYFRIIWVFRQKIRSKLFYIENKCFILKNNSIIEKKIIKKYKENNNYHEML